MNAFITAQGFAKTGMLSVLIGAVTNIILDPIFIFGFGLGVRGAAPCHCYFSGLLLHLGSDVPVWKKDNIETESLQYETSV
jgi:hypothetical protein